MVQKSLSMMKYGSTIKGKTRSLPPCAITLNLGMGQKGETMLRPIIAAFGLSCLLLATVPANAQTFIKAPFVRVYDGGPNGPVFVKAPFVTVDVPPSPAGIYLVPAYVPPPPPVYVFPPQPPTVVVPAPPPPPVIVTPAPVVVVPKKALLNHHEFARTFVPAAGKYDVTLIHPGNHAAVPVTFVLPPGHPIVRTGPRVLIFDYRTSAVEIHFAAFGKVKVQYH